MSTIASQITGISIVYSTICSGADLRKHESTVSLVSCGEFTIDWWIPRIKGSVTRNMFLFDDVIMVRLLIISEFHYIGKLLTFRISRSYLAGVASGEIVRYKCNQVNLVDICFTKLAEKLMNVP